MFAVHLHRCQRRLLEIFEQIKVWLFYALLLEVDIYLNVKG